MKDPKLTKKLRGVDISSLRNKRRIRVPPKPNDTRLGPVGRHVGLRWAAHAISQLIDRHGLRGRFTQGEIEAMEEPEREALLRRVEREHGVPYTAVSLGLACPPDHLPDEPAAGQDRFSRWVEYRDKDGQLRRARVILALGSNEVLSVVTVYPCDTYR